MTVGIDYYLAKKWEELLVNKPNTFIISVETDMCNAITNEQYWGPRYFLDKLIRTRNITYKFMSGRCIRSQSTQIKNHASF